MRFLSYSKIIIALFIYGFSSQLSSQIVIQIPDTTVCQHDEFTLPVFTKGVTPSDSILAYQTVLTYDPSQIRVNGVSHSETMIEAWGDPFVNYGSDRLSIAGFTTNEVSRQLVEDHGSFLTIDFEAIGDTTEITHIDIASFLMFNIDGAIGIDSLLGSTVHAILNFPPEIDAIPNMNMLEDGFQTLNIGDFIQDRNNATETLQIQVRSSDNVRLSFDTTLFELTIIPVQNWYGEAQISVHVQDSFSETDQDSFLIHVTSVPDPPGEFGLVAPSDSIIVDFSTGIRFTWQTSENVDIDDQVTYRFYLSPDPSFHNQETIQISGLTDTTFNFMSPLSNTHYYWAVLAIDDQGNLTWSREKFEFRIENNSDIESVQTVPHTFQLDQNYPNPFNVSTLCAFEIPVLSHVRLDIFDVNGRWIHALLDQSVDAGYHITRWNGENHVGRPMPSGVYYIRFEASGFIEQKKMILLR